MLFINNKEANDVLSMKECIIALEDAYGELGKGFAVNKPRTDMFSPNSQANCFHVLKTMAGSLPSKKVAALRVGSNIVGWKNVSGNIRKEGVRNAPGNKFLGLVLLFSTDTGEIISIMHDDVIQKMRVGATLGLAAKYLSNPVAKTVGILGSGGQARTHLSALMCIRGIEEVRVYSPNKKNRDKFATEMSKKFKIKITSVNDPETAVQGTDILCCTTNSVEQVIKPEWLKPGMFVSVVKPAEIGTALQRCNTVVINTSMVVPENFIPGVGRVEMHDPYKILNGGDKDKVLADETQLPWHEFLQLHEVFDNDLIKIIRNTDVTCFLNNIGLGIQFAALGFIAYENASKIGLGSNLAYDMFMQNNF